MTAQQWILLAIQASIVLTVVSFGLTATLRDAMFLLRSPGLLAKTLLSMSVAMPIVAAMIAAWADPPLAVKLALAALSVAPVPPIVQKKQVASGGRTEYVLGLMVTMSALAIVLVPLTLAVFNRAFGGHAEIAPFAVAKIVATTVLIPIVVALLIRHFWPGSARASHAIGLFANVVLGVSVVVLLIAMWPVIQLYIGNGVVLKLAAMAAGGLVIGHLLGGPDEANREVLATSTASRHPAVAIAVANAFPLAEGKEELGVIVLYLIVATVLTGLYQKWQSRRIAGATHG
jgi:bile acid:Na+ symporter, BASS family